MSHPSGLRIGIDGACWANRRGYGRYARSLLQSLAGIETRDRFLVFLDEATAADPTLPDRFEKVVVPTGAAPADAASASGRRSVKDLLRMGRAVGRNPVDVMYYPSAYTFFPLLELRRRTPAVVTIHDVIAERHPGMIFSSRRYRMFWQAKLAVAVRQANIVLTVSEYARDGIERQFKLPRSRVRVIIEAPDPVFQPRKRVCSDGTSRSSADGAGALPGTTLPSDTPYLLYVGGISPHKNLPTLVEAFERLIQKPGSTLHRPEPDLHLILVGDYKGDVFLSAYESLKSEIECRGLAGRVHFTGYIPDEELVTLYNQAIALVLPSFEEGFGLPAVEAAACGTPAIVSETGPAGGILGPAAITFPPRDTAALTRAMEAVVDDPARRAAMGREGLCRAAELSWDRAAQQLLCLLREVANA